MIKKIGIDELLPGMFIHDLNCGWLDHPFLKNSVRLKDAKTIDKIRALGICELYIDTERGIDAKYAPTQEEVNRLLHEKLENIALIVPDKPLTSGIKEESGRAQRLHSEANRVIRQMMEDIRFGQQPEIVRIEPLIESMVDSIFRNPNALLPLASLKSHDTYTFEHSVGVCTLMVAFGRQLEFERAQIHQLALGALLHDVGKSCIADEILNKPGKLSDSEFEAMKQHVNLSEHILRETHNLSQTALSIATEHHERIDGSGYPRHLVGEQISLYGQMASIADVYDAISSDRIYHKAMTPSQALKKLLEWSDHHFSPKLVQSFIRTLGIYPSGSLVRLESGRLGVVLEQSERNLLEPSVRVFYHALKQYYIPPEVIDLAKSQDRIVGYESFSKWQIDPYQWLPS
jgi:HD-GYP domain-containing protein (c-di-GMP phosphodiesterase class II)